MDGLIETCLFAQEWKTESDADIGVRVTTYAETGRARLFPTGAFLSFAVRESHQADVRSLPIGARTLLLDPVTKAVVVRGVNKFLDVSAVSTLLWADDGALWTGASVWLQRKMAGFVVTLFSLDGVTLHVASKHVVDGPHVDLARRVLEASLSPTQRRTLAADLLEMDAAVVCECILSPSAAGAGPPHPVPEHAAFDDRLVVLAVQCRRAVREVALPFVAVRDCAARWGLPAVPAWRAGRAAQLHEWLSQRHRWGGAAPDGQSLAEGFVVLVELPAARVAAFAGHSSFSIAPVRLKAKSVRYRVLRSLRAILLGESAAPPLLFHEVIAQWAVQSGVRDLRLAAETTGVSALCAEFERHAALHRQTRLRGADASVGAAFARLVALTEREASGAALHVVLLCGLPAAGKSTLAAAMARGAEKGLSALRGVVRLSRDAIAADETPNASSGHQRRRRRAAGHRAMANAARRAWALLASVDGPALLILDACHATVDARRWWRALFPETVESFSLLHVTCDDPRAAGQRLAARVGHDVLRGADDAQTAMRRVRRLFAPPTEAEGAAVMRCNTAAAAPDETAAQLLARFGPGPVGRAAVYDHRQAAAAFASRCAAIRAAVCGGEESPTLAPIPPVPPVPGRAIALGLPRAVLVDAAVRAILSAAGDGGDGGSAFWASLRSVFWRWRPPAARGGRVAMGHVRWLRGWLLAGRDGPEGNGPPEGSAAGQEVWRRALEERLECHAPTPHVTLTPRGAAPAPSPSSLAPGSTVEVTLDAVLLDRMALCFGATVAAGGGIYTQQLSEAVPLHVTLAHAHNVKAAYAGDMFARFEEWEGHNRELEQARADGASVKRSREKFFNFVKVKLDTPITVRGVVSETSSI